MKDIITGFFMAWGNFSWIPCPCKVWDEKAKKWMLALMQFTGLLAGLGQLLVFTVASLLVKYEILNSHFIVVAGILTIVPFFLTGFIHVDGFMDCCDAIMSRRDIEQRQKILKDSRVGAFAVVMCVCLFIGYFAAMLQLINSYFAWHAMVALLVVPVVSRSLASNDVLRLKPLSISQYAAILDKNKNRVYQVTCMIVTIVIIGVISLISYFTFYTLRFVIVGIVGASLGQIISRRVAVKNLGGINGDIAGYSIVWGELIGAMAIALVC